MADVLSFFFILVFSMAIVLGVFALLIDVWRMFFGTPEDKVIARAEQSASERLTELAARENLSDEQRRQKAKAIVDDLEIWRTAFRNQAARHERAARVTWAVGGLSSIALLLMHRYDALKWLVGAAELVMSSAHAATRSEPREEVRALIPYIASGLVTLIALCFVAALLVVLFTKDVKENRARIKAADSIIKTFGGFLTGLVMALFH